MSTQNIQIAPPRQITGRMVLIGLIVFFGVIAAVNGVFMYFALDTWPGLTTQDSYKKGIDYNKTLEINEVQRELGWSLGVSLEGNKNLIVDIYDRENGLITGLNVQALIERPLGESKSIHIELDEQSSGKYVASFAELSPGRWMVNLIATSSTGSTVRVQNEIFVKP